MSEQSTGAQLVEVESIVRVTIERRLANVGLHVKSIAKKSIQGGGLMRWELMLTINTTFGRVAMSAENGLSNTGYVWIRALAYEEPAYRLTLDIEIDKLVNRYSFESKQLSLIE